ncbi:hypothetical protein [Modestobacter sp. VKM Ac-2985]|uniref:hypothetical protein n=1 Tax=Modestobacter sp. VKM Ac-2985 TaxID=3004139 RepID=UPI0022AB6FF8|nr:hypothetical protein [Modestobacter sp. VKM Ac-2985]MCZ2840013.1 hypothetical protein [Modestobacter sp. VKM Ac-2985]
MSRPTPALDGPAGTARGRLPDDAHDGFDRLTHAVLTGPGSGRQAALGAVLRGLLPGTAGVRWLHAEGLSPTSRAADLTAAHWLSLHAAWLAHDRAPRTGSRATGHGPRPDSRHGHAPGAQAIPRYY